MSTPALLDPLTLLGTWGLTRTIVELASGQESLVDGNTELVAEPDGRIRWSEQGVLRRGGLRVPVTRVLFIEPRDDGWFVTFDDGRDFHPWQPGRTVEHRCAPDLYAGMVAAAGESWTVTWRVTGPAKDYTMASVLSRR